MKRIIAGLFVIVSLATAASAADEVAGAYFKWGGIEFTYPLANVSTIALYDFWKGEGLLGAETILAQYKDLNINFGAVTSFQANGMPFVSLDYNLARAFPRYPVFLDRIGVWGGHDFRNNDNRAGIKAGKALW